MSWKDCLFNPEACVASAGKDAISQTVWDGILNWLAKGLTDMTTKVFDKFTASTTPDFNQHWWRENFDLIVTISLPLLVIAFVLQCAAAAIRREPARLGQAVFGALLGTAGVPFAVAVVGSCGQMVDRLSTTILGTSDSVTKGFRRIIDLTKALASMNPQGGVLLTAIQLAILATIALYFVMIVREVALTAFVVLAPIAMASWTWSATRHWLRRWVELVGALLFSKMVMAVIFALGLSAMSNSSQNGDSSLGTFLAGSLLFAMAAFAPMATYSFIHWAGDQSQSALYALQQGTAGASAVKARVEQAYRWAAFDFTGSRSGPGAVVAGLDDADDESAPTGPTNHDTTAQDQPTSNIGPDSVATAPADTAHTTQTSADRVAGQDQPGDTGQNGQGEAG
ncbi:hypothetical protein JOF29_002796 [Kribbella aluminosa]|uniref:TrbL/VirB6 plasmid conjugal transfer protein n=1 Tax=Kribbella aluminosa TaxID=416017 RepID=A0ABS4UJ94_9ACTN|nr:type IV secretion system protein [Kribbella aluminosa]MBP2351713.1 hypothetical protein [Kribbella aluminosa]